MLDDDFKEEKTFIAHENKIVSKVTYDNSAMIDANKAQKNSLTRSEQYKGNMVHVGRMHRGDIERLKNMGYNLLSPDPEERKRALLYVQTYEKHLLTVNGKPFAKKRVVWV